MSERILADTTQTTNESPEQPQPKYRAIGKFERTLPKDRLVYLPKGFINNIPERSGVLVYDDRDEGKMRFYPDSVFETMVAQVKENPDADPEWLRVLNTGVESTITDNGKLRLDKGFLEKAGIDQANNKLVLSGAGNSFVIRSAEQWAEWHERTKHIGTYGPDGNIRYE